MRGWPRQYGPETPAPSTATWEMAKEFRLRDGVFMEGRSRSAGFRHDPGPLFDALSHDEAPPSLPIGNYKVTVRVKNGDLVAEW